MLNTVFATNRIVNIYDVKKNKCRTESKSERKENKFIDEYRTEKLFGLISHSHSLKQTMSLCQRRIWNVCLLVWFDPRLHCARFQIGSLLYNERQTYIHTTVDDDNNHWEFVIW